MEERWIKRSQMPEGTELSADGDGRLFFIASDGNATFVKEDEDPSIEDAVVEHEELKKTPITKALKNASDEELANMDPVTRSRILASRMTTEERLSKLEDEHALLISEFKILENRIHYLQNRG